MRMTDLHCKEVICISDGRRLGFVSDVEVRIPEDRQCLHRLLGNRKHPADIG